jgi:hypothetical protein
MYLLMIVPVAIALAVFLLNRKKLVGIKEKRSRLLKKRRAELTERNCAFSGGTQI